VKFVEEIVVEEFLPTFRSMLAEALRERGLTQHEVATALGISQSAVSKYAHGEIKRREEVMQSETVTEVVERIADGLQTGDISQVQALVEAEVLIRQLEEGGLIAQLHEAAMPELADHEGYVNLHDPESTLRTSERVRASVRRALRQLTNLSGFAGLIPHVGSNLVECLPTAKTINDVVGVPGRIFDVKGRTTVPGDPEFGVSEHVASLLLAVHQRNRGVRAAVNIRYDESLVSTLETSGHPCYQFEPDSPEESLTQTLNNEPYSPPFVCYHTGGYGIEAIIYIFARQASAAVDAVRPLS
jgi:predicted fused transcriptional regulator/phosphomethylpyrimidine kinase/predicted transcriptional regulator